MKTKGFKTSVEEQLLGRFYCDGDVERQLLGQDYAGGDVERQLLGWNRYRGTDAERLYLGALAYRGPRKGPRGAEPAPAGGDALPGLKAG